MKKLLFILSLFITTTAFTQGTFTTAKNQIFTWSNSKWSLQKTTFDPIVIEFVDKKIIVKNENRDVYSPYMLVSKTEETKTEYGSYEFRCLDMEGIKCTCIVYFEGDNLVRVVFTYNNIKVVYSKYVE